MQGSSGQKQGGKGCGCSDDSKAQAGTCSLLPPSPAHLAAAAEVEHKADKLLLLPLREQRRHRGGGADRVGARLGAVGGLEAHVACQRRDRLLHLGVAPGRGGV